ncbi:hypothetical protein IVB45_17535 [Bradyrhizobium sp. 4]|uniref:hypothetical protein n=1 Tax=unclassified Bradyrhizobium TaxID=2631580 RepID=UPI001FF9FE17|nr:MULTISPECIES: hypothetical protein [unclassified Bradyrhizobium]MCK1402022.1 hypothetical protein [Bradyrhizobium sp. 39]MCK1751258.1 hypothetical protein [Bradyrhizobium sp. 135]UPJ38511.1 hypothetical protein IVB45_17535 [Bradyrhizobium sp. 4]
MDIQQVVREVTVRGSSQGMDQVARAYNQVAEAADRTATVTEKTTKAQQSAEAAVEKLRLRYQDGYRQQQQLVEAQQIYQRAVDQGRVSQAAAAAELANIQGKLGQVTAAQKAAAPVTAAYNAQISSLTGNLGLAGQVLTALGPAGVATAVGIGAIVAVLSLASEKSHELAQKAKELKEFSEATGLSTTQFQALRAEAGKFGIDSDTLATGLGRFTEGFNELRNGSGELLTQIRKINPALADQMQQVTDTASAFTLFGKAVASTDNIFQRNALLKAGLGRGASTYGALFDSAPNVGAITDAYAAAGKGIDENMINKLRQLQIDIDKTRSAASGIFASAFGTSTLEAEKKYAEQMVDIAKSFKYIVDNVGKVKLPEIELSDNSKTILNAYMTVVNAEGKAIKIVFNPVGSAIDGVKALAGVGAKKYDESTNSIANFQSPANSYSTFQRTGPGAAADKTPQARLADMEHEISLLGSAATASERYQAALLKLTVGQEGATLSGEKLARAQAALQLDRDAELIGARVSALGAAASVTDLLAQKQNALAKAQLAGANLTPAEIENQKRLVVEQANGVGAINAQIDALRVQQATLGMSVGQAAAYNAVETKRLEAIRNGAPLDEQQLAALREKAQVLGQLTQKSAQDAAQNQAKFDRETMFLSDTEKQIAQIQQRLHGNDWKSFTDDALSGTLRVNAALQEGKDTAVDFTKSFVQGLMQGKSGMEALTDAAGQLSAKLADKAITDLFSGNFVQAGIEGALAIGTAIFAGDQKAKKALQEAQDQWRKMADQVAKFNAAAAGFDVGPLTNELQSLFSTLQQLQGAAIKAKDMAGVAKLWESVGRGIVRIVDEFGTADDALSPLQKAIKGVNDEARGLKETLDQFYVAGFRDEIDAEAKARIQALIAQYTDALTSGLAERLNTAQGKGYLNDATALLKQHATDLSSAAELGNNPAILAQISATFGAEAQKIVQDAGLVGDQFQNFIKLFPDLAGVVHEVTIDITDSIKTISDYLASLQLGSNSILSPQEQLAAAQAQFSQQLVLAQGGNADAIGSITKYADQLLGQAKSYFASSDGYTDIYKAVTAALSGLTGAGGSGYSASATTSSVASVSNIQAITPIVSNGTAAANDNGAHFAQQTNTLVQAIAAAASAEVAAIQDLRDALKAELRGVRSAVESKGGKPLRPADKTDRKAS